MNCSLPGSSIHGIFQARVLEWVAIAFSETNSQSLPKLMSIESVMPSNHIILCQIPHYLNLICTNKPKIIGVVVQSLMSDSATPWTAACQASLSFIVSQSVLELISIVSLRPSNHLFLCHALLFLPAIFPSIRVFSNESALHIRWPKYWSFSFGISSSNEYSELISFRIDWFDLLAVQGTIKSLLQHLSSKASILWY